MPWKVYAWAVALLSGIGLAGSPLSEYQPFSIVNAGVNAVSAIGLLAFAYRRRVLSERFWQTWLVLAVAWLVAVQANLLPTRIGVPHVNWTADWLGVPAMVGLGLVSMIILLPLYYGLYRYSFRSHDKWPTGASS